jgi:formylglycine-generating enzyme required for sulfatase activity
MPTGYNNDRPTRDDQLDFTAYRTIIGDILRRAETPITVGIFGSWGSGKTSLLQMLREDMKSGEASGVPPVWFNAWQYDRAEALWRALILRVLDAFRPKYSDGENKGEYMPYEALPEPKQKMLEKLDLLEASVYGDTEWQLPSKLSIDPKKLAKGSLNDLVEVLLSIFPSNVGPALSAKYKEIHTRLTGHEPATIAQAFLREVVMLRREQLHTLDQFRSAFENLLNEYVVKAGSRLFVFVDDLDRCLPEKAVEVLEAIKLFLEAEGCVFVIGMDRDVVSRGIEVRYKHLAVADDSTRPDLPITGDSYLQKMIQLPFYLPPLSPERIERYITELEAKEALEPLPECGPRLFALGLPCNPRQVKLALNSFRVFRAIARQRLQEGTLAKPISWPLLIKTIIIQTQSEFKHLYEAWQAHKTLVGQLEDKYRQADPDDEGAFGAGTAQAAAAAVEGRVGGTLAAQSQLLRSFLVDDTAAHRRLRKLLSYGQEPTVNTPPEERELFHGLSRAQIEDYIHLVSAGASREELVETTDTAILESLLSGDPAKVKDAVQAVLETAPESSQREPYQRALQRALAPVADGGMGLSMASRIHAGNALAYLGDHRPGVLHPPAMVPIAGGSFLYGKDQQSMDIAGFQISKYPVTNAQYKAFLDGNKEHPVPESREWFTRPYCWDREKRTHPDGKANHPVVLVSLYDAQPYCDWLSTQGMGEFSLPTEQQWERAARGTDGRQYPWTGPFDVNKANTVEGGAMGTTAVGAYPDGASPAGTSTEGANPDRVLDCAGNVWEWTATKGSEGNLCCGGSWANSQHEAVCWHRNAFFPGLQLNVLGFRVVRRT